MRKGPKYTVQPLGSYPAAWHEVVKTTGEELSRYAARGYSLRWHTIAFADGTGGLKNRLMRLRTFRQALEAAGEAFPGAAGWWLSHGWTLGFRSRALPNGQFAVELHWKPNEEEWKTSIESAFARIRQDPRLP